MVVNKLSEAAIDCAPVVNHAKKTSSNMVCTADGVHDILHGTANDNVLLAKQDDG